jgi:copper transport protein
MDMNHDMNMDMSPDAGQAYYGISRTPKLIFQVDLVPARAGANTMLLTVLGPGNKPQRVLKWTATASRPTGSAQSLPIVVLPMSQGVAYANPQIPVAGDWRLSVTVSTPDQRETTVSQIVKIG